MTINSNKSRKWKSLVNSFKRSSLSKAKFCEKNSISKSRLNYWILKFKIEEEEGSSTSQGSFVSLNKVPEDSNIKITLNDSLVIEFDNLPDPIWMKDLLTNMASNAQH